MHIKITIDDGFVKIDVSVNRLQKIKDALEIIAETGIIRFDTSASGAKSLRNHRYLDLDASFAENAIFDGDILQINYGN